MFGIDDLLVHGSRWLLVRRVQSIALTPDKLDSFFQKV